MEFRCGGRPVCVLPVLLTRQQGVAEEVGAAAGAWQEQQLAQEQQQAPEQREEHGDLAVSSGLGQDLLDGLLEDLGTWECHVCSYTQQGGTSEQQHAGGTLHRPSVAQLSVLGAHLLQYAESCGLSRTAEWIREGLGVLGEQQERQEAQGKAQGQGRGQDLSACNGGGDGTGAGLVPQKLLPGAAAGSGAAVLRQRGGEGRDASGRGTRVADGREGPVGGLGRGAAAAGFAGARWRWMDVAPAGVVEQGL